MDTEEKIVLAKAEDLLKLCDRHATSKFSAFLDGHQQRLIEDNVNTFGYNTMFFGGSAESERRIFGVFPDWQEAAEDDFPITVIQVVHSFGGPLTHRAYLGSMMSLGIDRSKTGDILIDGNTAFIFVMSDIADYIINNLTKIGNKGVALKKADTSKTILPMHKFEIINIVAASARLDAVTASALNISRSAASEYITGGKVSVNHREICETAYQLSEGELISIRGFGRVIFESAGGQTRSGRTHFVLKKYI